MTQLAAPQPPPTRPAIRCWRNGPPPTRLRRSTASSPSISGRPMPARSPTTRPRSRPLRPIRRRRASTIRSRRWSLSGRALARVGDVFHLLTGAHTNDALLEIEREISPQMARHWNKINTNAALFGRVDTLMRGMDKLGLDAEQKRVLERYHTGFRRAGAGLDDRCEEAPCRNHRASCHAWAPRSARTCSPTSRPSRSRSTVKPSSPACPTSCARR